MTVDPSHRRGYHAELERMVDDLKHRLPCCPNCIHWAATGELCTYANQNIRPPAPVIAFGCAAYEQDVPF